MADRWADKSAAPMATPAAAGAGAGAPQLARPHSTPDSLSAPLPGARLMDGIRVAPKREKKDPGPAAVMNATAEFTAEDLMETMPTGRDGTLGTLDDIRLARLHMRLVRERNIKMRARGVEVTDELGVEASEAEKAKDKALGLVLPDVPTGVTAGRQSKVMEALRNRAAVSRTVKHQLQLRGLSLATADKVGVERDTALRERLILALNREMRGKRYARLYNPKDRVTAYRRVRGDNLSKEIEYALQDDDYSRVLSVFRRGGDPEHIMRNGQSALNRAVLYKEHDFIRELLQELPNKVSPEFKDSHHDTPLVTAARGEMVDMVEFLISVGCNPNGESGSDPSNGITPLMTAARIGSVPTMTTLLKYGADINYQNAAGTTPLIYAIKHKQVEAVRLLLLKGADKTIHDRFERGPVWWAREKGVQTVVTLLSKGGARRRKSHDFITVLGGGTVQAHLMRAPSDHPVSSPDAHRVLSRDEEQIARDADGEAFSPEKELKVGRRHRAVLQGTMRNVAAVLAFQRAGKKRAKEREAKERMQKAAAAARRLSQAQTGGEPPLVDPSILTPEKTEALLRDASQPAGDVDVDKRPLTPYEKAARDEDRRQAAFAAGATPIVTRMDESGLPTEMGVPMAPFKHLDPLAAAPRRQSWEGVLHPQKHVKTAEEIAAERKAELARLDRERRKKLKDDGALTRPKSAGKDKPKGGDSDGDGQAEAKPEGKGDDGVSGGADVDAGAGGGDDDDDDDDDQSSSATESEGEKKERLKREDEARRQKELEDAELRRAAMPWDSLTEEEREARENTLMLLEERDMREHQARIVRKAKWASRRKEINSMRFEKLRMEHVGAEIVPFVDPAEKEKEMWWKTKEEREAEEAKERSPREDMTPWKPTPDQTELHYEKVHKHRRLSLPPEEAAATDAIAKRGRRGGVSKHEGHGHVVYQKCQQCKIRVARLRCMNCAQLQCEQCCINIHRQPSRRHHHVKPVSTHMSTEGVEVRDPNYMQKHTLDASLGVAHTIVNSLHNMMYAGLGLHDQEAVVHDRKSLFEESAARRQKKKRLKLEQARKAQQDRTKEKLDKLYQKPAEVSYARFLITHGRYTEAQKILQTILDGQERQLGHSAMPVARTLAVFAMMWERREQWREASDNLDRSLNIQMAFTPPDDDLVLETTWRLAAALDKQRRFRDEEAVWEAALSAREVRASHGHLRELLPQEAQQQAAALAKALNYGPGVPGPLCPLHEAAALLMLEAARKAEVKDMTAEDERARERAVNKERRLERRAERQRRRDAKLAGRAAGEDISSSESGESYDSDDFAYVQGRYVKVKKSKYQIDVSGDADTLRAVLITERWLRKFYRFARKEKSQMGLGFLIAVAEFKTMDGSGALPPPGVLPNPATNRATRATAMWARYIKPTGALPSVPMILRNAVAKDVAEGVRSDTFDDCYENVFQLVLEGPFKRYMESPKGRRFAIERALALGIGDRWTVEQIGWLASSRRIRKAIQAQRIVRGFVTRNVLAREAAWAQRQRELAQMHALRREATVVSQYIVRQIMGRMDLLAQHRERMAKESATRMTFRVLDTAVGNMLQRERTPLQRAVSRFRRRICRAAFAVGRKAVYSRERRRLDEARAAAMSVYAHGVATAIQSRLLAADEEPMDKRLFREAVDTYGLVPSDSDSDGEGERQETSTAVRRRTWNRARKLRWASRMVQRHWRGHRAREAIRAIINSIFVKRFDKATQRAYFVDTRDGSIRWLAPYAGKITFKIMCVQCDSREAVKQCLDCEEPYCAECFRDFHKGARVRHEYIEITPDHAICPYCNEKLQMRFCSTCSEGACVSCHENRHPKGPKKGHPWEAMLHPSEVRKGIVAVPYLCEYCHLRAPGEPKQAVAVRCFECDDKFCIDCYEKRHSKGARANHTWEEYHILTSEEAASKLQGIWRAKRARRRLRDMMKALFTRERDEEGNWWYLNSMTGEYQYEKPKLLGSEDVAKRKAHELTEAEAARTIQGMVRSRRAREWLRTIMRGVFKKERDPETGEFYFLNTRTGESMWQAPRLLGEGGEYLVRVHAKDMTDEQAARKLQALWRARNAKRALRRMIKSMYRKVWDYDHAAFYYENTLSGEVHWHKPVLLGDVDDVPRYRAEDLSEDDAAVVITHFIRFVVARRLLLARARTAWTRVEDTWGTGKEYYLNNHTGETVWAPPLVLRRMRLEDITWGEEYKGEGFVFGKGLYMPTDY